MERERERPATPVRVLPVGGFYGQILRGARVGGLVLTEVRTPRNFSAPPHVHQRAYFELVLEGRWTESCGTSRRDLEPWVAIYHPRAECHCNDFQPVPGRSLHVELSDEWRQRLERHGFDSDSPLQSRSSAVAAPLLRVADELRH